MSLANILHRSKYSLDAAILMHAALETTSDYDIVYFTLGNIYGVSCFMVYLKGINFRGHKFSRHKFSRHKFSRHKFSRHKFSRNLFSRFDPQIAKLNSAKFTSLLEIAKIYSAKFHR